MLPPALGTPLVDQIKEIKDVNEFILAAVVLTITSKQVTARTRKKKKTTNDTPSVITTPPGTHHLLRSRSPGRQEKPSERLGWRQPSPNTTPWAPCNQHRPPYPANRCAASPIQAPCELPISVKAAGQANSLPPPPSPLLLSSFFVTRPPPPPPSGLSLLGVAPSWVGGTLSLLVRSPKWDSFHPHVSWAFLSAKGAAADREALGYAGPQRIGPGCWGLVWSSKSLSCFFALCPSCRVRQGNIAGPRSLDGVLVIILYYIIILFHFLYSPCRSRAWYTGGVDCF